MEHGNKNIVETFVEFFTRAPHHIQNISEISAKSGRMAISQVPTLDGQTENLKINANVNANADSGLKSNERINNQTAEQSRDDLNKQFAHIATPISPINLLSQPNIKIRPIQWSTILTAANNSLPDKIRILKETGHDSWICVRETKERKKPIAEIYCANPEFSLSGFLEDDMKAIDNTFNVPRTGFQVKECFRTDSQVDQFNVVFAYALCFALNQPLENVNNGLRESVDNVRQLIIHTLLNGELPPDEQSIWLQPVSINREGNRSVAEPSVRVDMSVGPIRYDQIGQPSGESTTFEISTRDRDVINLLLQPNASLQPEQQSIIAEAAHRLLPKEIWFSRAAGDVNWHCIQFIPNQIKTYNVYYFKPGFQLSEESKGKIEQWYTTPDCAPSPVCNLILQDVVGKNEFLYTVATTFCIAMKQDIESYLGKEVSIEDVRKKVVKLLLDGVPLDVADASIWRRS